MTGLAPALALLLAQVPVGNASSDVAGTPAEETDVVETRTDSEERMTVPVHVDGQGPFRFLIDTGSQRTIVSTSLATQLQLDPGPTIRIVSLAGVDAARTARLQAFELGKRTYSGTMVPLMERHNIGADGIIGTDSLQGQRVLLDFSNDTIEIGSAKSLGGNSGYEIVVTARQRSGQLIMSEAKLDGVSLKVIVDTGAGISIGNRALQQALAKRGSVSGPIRLTSVTGDTVVADLGFARRLDIKEIFITNIIIAFTDTPAFTALDLDRRPALFLGMRELRLFERVAIDFHKRRVMFDLPGER